MFLYRILNALEREEAEYAIAGGWAVSLHGAVRGTVDLDLVVAFTEENLERAVVALAKEGLESRLPLTVQDIIQFRFEYIEKRKMFAWRFMNPGNQAEIVDLLINDDLRKIDIKNIKVGAKTIPVVSLSHLIRMKKKSGRPQDLEDIKALELLLKEPQK